MALIAVCCHDTEENGRTKFTEQTLACLMETVDAARHRIIVIDNASCEETKKVLKKFSFLALNNLKVITNPENIGTAKAINQAWKHRKPGEHLIKMDNDCIVHHSGWVDEMEEAIARDSGIGQVALKRKDLLESPDRNDDFKSQLQMLPHKNGERWIVVERAKHVMGTCVMHSSRLVDKIGGMYQMDGLYGFDDSLMSLRSTIAGYKNVFLPHIHIDHIDPGGDAYTQWKRDYAGEMMNRFNEAQKSFLSGKLSIKFEL